MLIVGDGKLRWKGVNSGRYVLLFLHWLGIFKGRVRVGRDARAVSGGLGAKERSLVDGIVVRLVPPPCPSADKRGYTVSVPRTEQRQAEARQAFLPADASPAGGSPSSLGRPLLPGQVPVPLFLPSSALAPLAWSCSASAPTSKSDQPWRWCVILAHSQLTDPPGQNLCIGSRAKEGASPSEPTRLPWRSLPRLVRAHGSPSRFFHLSARSYHRLSVLSPTSYPRHDLSRPHLRAL